MMIIIYVMHLMSEASDKHNKAVLIQVSTARLSSSVLRMKSKSQENKFSVHTQGTFMFPDALMWEI